MQDDDHISLDNNQIEDLLHEVRGILTSNDLLGVAAAMGGGGSKRNKNSSLLGGFGGLGGINKRRRSTTVKSSGTISPTNSLDSSYNSGADSYDTQRYDAELLKTETREATMLGQGGGSGGSGSNSSSSRSSSGSNNFSPLERKMKRTEQNFIEERRRNNNETNTIRSKSKESTRLRLQERERTRVLQRFNPEAIRQVAEQTTDELTKSRLMAIISGEVEQSNGTGNGEGGTGRGSSPDKQQRALEELNTAASQQGLGGRRVRYVFCCCCRLCVFGSCGGSSLLFGSDFIYICCVQ